MRISNRLLRRKENETSVARETQKTPAKGYFEKLCLIVFGMGVPKHSRTLPPHTSNPGIFMQTV